MQGVFIAVVAGGPRLGDLRAGATARGHRPYGGLGGRWHRRRRGRGRCWRVAFPALLRYRRRPRTVRVAWRTGTGRYARCGDGRGLGGNADMGAVAPSGEQWTIASGDHEAVIVEVGGGLRSYRVAGVDVVDGYGEDEMCPGRRRPDPRAVAEPHPRRSVHLRRRGPPALADRAGPAQRHPRPGQLGPVAGGRRGRRRASRSSTTCRRSRATRGRCALRTTWRVGAGRPAGRARGHQPGATSPARSGSPSTRTWSCPASPIDDLHAHGAGPQPAAGGRSAAADRRGPGGRQRVRLHRAAPARAPPSWTRRSVT